jgi:hypothetical protein
MHLREEKWAVLVGNPEGKRPIGRCVCKLEDNVKMDWIHLAQDRE